MTKSQIFWREEEPRECITKRPLSSYYLERYGWYFSFALYALGMAAYLSNAYTASMFLLGFAFALSISIHRSVPAAFMSMIVSLVTLVAGIRYVMTIGMATFPPIAFQPLIAAVTTGILVNIAAYAMKKRRW